MHGQKMRSGMVIFLLVFIVFFQIVSYVIECWRFEHLEKAIASIHAEHHDLSEHAHRDLANILENNFLIFKTDIMKCMYHGDCTYEEEDKNED